MDLLPHPVRQSKQRQHHQQKSGEREQDVRDDDDRDGVDVGGFRVLVAGGVLYPTAGPRNAVRVRRGDERLPREQYRNEHHQHHSDYLEVPLAEPLAAEDDDHEDVQTYPEYPHRLDESSVLDDHAAERARPLPALSHRHGVRVGLVDVDGDHLKEKGDGAEQPAEAEVEGEAVNELSVGLRLDDEEHGSEVA